MTLGMDAALWPQAVVDAIAIPATQQYPFWVKHGHRNYIPNYLDFSIPRYFNISPFTCYDCKHLTGQGHSNVYINAWKVRPFFLRVSVADPQSASIEDNHQFDLVQPSQKLPLNLGALWNLEFCKRRMSSHFMDHFWGVIPIPPNRQKMASSPNKTNSNWNLPGGWKWALPNGGWFHNKI